MSAGRTKGKDRRHLGQRTSRLFFYAPYFFWESEELPCDSNGCLKAFPQILLTHTCLFSFRQSEVFDCFLSTFSTPDMQKLSHLEGLYFTENSLSSSEKVPPVSVNMFIYLEPTPTVYF